MASPSRLGLPSIHFGARFQLEAGAPSLDVNDVCFSDFDRNMRQNLADETWADDRDAYGAVSN